MARRPFLAPEVTQTSVMDCGPACLKAMLSAAGIEVGYDRLREACQTDVDGTSIDTLEDILVSLSLPAFQYMLPVDALFEAGRELLPAILVVRRADGASHFVVVWRVVGTRVQIMDPASGRRWVTRQQLERMAYVHEQPVTTKQFKSLAKDGPMLAWLRGQLADLGIEARDNILDMAMSLPTWRLLSGVDATARFVKRLVRVGLLQPGPAATLVFEKSIELFQTDINTMFRLIPVDDFYGRGHPGAVDDGKLLLSGAVLLAMPESGLEGIDVTSRALENDRELPAALRDALVQREPWVPGELLKLAGPQARALTAGLALTVLVTAAVTIGEALLFRACLELPAVLGVAQQRLAAALGFAAFLVLVLLVRFLLVRGTQRLGRLLETNARIATFLKIPRLTEAFFRSRLMSDMAERAHSLHELRSAPEAIFEFLRLCCELAIVVIAIALIDPLGGLIALAGSGLAMLLFWLGAPLVDEQERRMQTHAGALTTHYLDALLGMAPVRTHGGEQSLRREHEALLVGWVEAGQQANRLMVLGQTVIGIVTTTIIVATVGTYVARSEGREGLLLLLFWCLRIPELVMGLILFARTWPRLKHRFLRVVEPLRGAERLVASEEVAAELGPVRAAQVDIVHTDVVAGGHSIIKDLSVSLAPGEHVAVVGRSGAGKSSFVGLLLGTHEFRGEVRLYGRAAGRAELEALRRRMAWVDPAVQIWNRTLLDNVLFGSESRPRQPLTQVVSDSDLKDVLTRMPNGFQTQLGEGGGLLSGGEGQRVRLARAMLPADASLVILDEAFRGLDGETRRDLLLRAREYWRDATLVCITHDLAAADDFDRVLVFEGGRLVEDDHPARLKERPHSMFNRLYAADREVDQQIWSSAGWRHWRVEQGRLEEGNRNPEKGGSGEAG